ncbi:MAG: Di-hem oxidoreductase, putative peroxidase [Massilia sp.]|nr:Di-hem oxidoreductase, putative peroxidase [Massilia sp.]
MPTRGALDESGNPVTLTATPIDPPSLLVRPWHQAGNSVSLRDFTNTSYHHHHGIESTERFGAGVDPDGDGFMNEMTRADVTAATVFLAVMAVPGQVIPNEPEVERAIRHGQRLFAQFRCAQCHVPALPLSRQGWSFVEPGPFNPIGNLRAGDVRPVRVDLNDLALPLPRLAPAQPRDQFMMVPAYTDFKLHDVSAEAEDMPVESLDMNRPVWAPKFAVGNRRFLTRRLWGIANSGPYFHHGMFSTMRQAVLGHAGRSDRLAQGVPGGLQDRARHADRIRQVAAGAAASDDVTGGRRKIPVQALGSERRQGKVAADSCSMLWLARRMV